MFRITAFSDYREYSPAARRRILARIKADSYDAVRFRIDRAMTEVALRRYDDSFMDSFFDDAAAVGIKVVPSVSFHTPPWAREAELSFDEPETWRSVQLFLAHVVSRLWRRKELAFFRILYERTRQGKRLVIGKRFRSEFPDKKTSAHRARGHFCKI